MTRRHRLEQLATAVVLSYAGLLVGLYRVLRGCHCGGCNP